MALELAKNPTVLIVNDTAFAHGGLLPEHGKLGLSGGLHPAAPRLTSYLILTQTADV